MNKLALHFNFAEKNPNNSDKKTPLTKKEGFIAEKRQPSSFIFCVGANLRKEETSFLYNAVQFFIPIFDLHWSL